jgi:hypothetical protein
VGCGECVYSFEELGVLEDGGNSGDQINAHMKKAHTKIPHRRNPSHKCSHEKHRHGKLLTRKSTHIEKFSNSQYFQVIHS